MKRTLHSIQNHTSQTPSTHSRGWTVKISLLSFAFMLLTSSWAQENLSSTRTVSKSRQAPQIVQQHVEFNPADLSNSLWVLHEEMDALKAKINDSSVFRQKTEPSVVDFNRLCPNYPLAHFSEMEQASLLVWVERYPSEAKALKEILEYMNSELKK